MPSASAGIALCHGIARIKTSGILEKGHEMNDSDLWAYLNGKLVRGNDAVLPLTDRGVQWGDAVYDSIRTYAGKPFQVPFRIDRFFRSLQYTRINPGITKEELAKATAEVIEANMQLSLIHI